MRTVHLSRYGLVMLLFLAIWNVVQAQDSLGMHHVATLDYWSSAGDIQMVDDLAYVMGGLSGLHIMSLADSANPVEVGRYTWYPWNVTGEVYVTGNRAYLGLGNTGVVLDISDPANLIILGEWDATIGCGITDITLVHGDIAIAQSEEDMPYILDVSDPTNVHYIGEFTDIPGPAYALGMAGEYLCMKGWPGGVILYDISDPTQPQRVAACDTTLQAGGGTLSGNYAYVVTYSDGLHIIDLNNPLQPSLVAACDSGGGDVTVTGPHAIITHGGLRIWNVADPAHPVFEGAVGYPPGSYGFFGGLSSSGNLVCVGNLGTKVVEVVDISNPAAPSIVSEFGNYGHLKQLVISGTVGYVADIYVGLRTIDLADPNHISELDNMYEYSFIQARSIAIRGNYAYEAVGYWRLFVADVSNPAQLDSLWCFGWSSQNCNYLKVLTVGDYLYAFDFHSSGPSYIQTFDLTNPEIPELVNSLAIPQLSETGYFGVTASNGYIYLVQYNYFKVFSLADPAAPQEVGSCGLPVPNLYARALSVVINGNYAYVANNGGGVVVVNIANPTSPNVVTTMGGFYRRVAVSQNVLFANDPYYGIYVMDILNPANPTIIGYYSTHEDINDMQVQGQYLFTTSPSEFRVYQCDSLISGVVQPERTPHEFTLHPCYPNPFNSTLVIPFTIPVQKEVIINISNILGQRVQEFVLPHQSPGMHNVIWNAESYASGLYIVQLISGNRESKQKIVLLK